MMLGQVFIVAVSINTPNVIDVYSTVCLLEVYHFVIFKNFLLLSPPPICVCGGGSNMEDKRFKACIKVLLVKIWYNLVDDIRGQLACKPGAPLVVVTCFLGSRV